MATFTSAQQLVVKNVISYLAGSYEKPIDDRAADDLSTLHTTLGFPSQISFLEGMGNAPIYTLIQAIKNQLPYGFLSGFITPGIPPLVAPGARASDAVGDKLDNILSYLLGNYAKDVDQRVADDLALVATVYQWIVDNETFLHSINFTVNFGGTEFEQALKDSPYSVLIKLLYITSSIN